jgi:hypothetical protein
MSELIVQIGRRISLLNSKVGSRTKLKFTKLGETLKPIGKKLQKWLGSAYWIVGNK